jgi:hypothetical protein
VGTEDAGWIPDEVLHFFSLPNVSCRTVALESTQPLNTGIFHPSGA